MHKILLIVLSVVYALPISADAEIKQLIVNGNYDAAVEAISALPKHRVNERQMHLHDMLITWEKDPAVAAYATHIKNAANSLVGGSKNIFYAKVNQRLASMPAAIASPVAPVPTISVPDLVIPTSAPIILEPVVPTPTLPVIADISAQVITPVPTLETLPVEQPNIKVRPKKRSWAERNFHYVIGAAAATAIGIAGIGLFNSKKEAEERAKAEQAERERIARELAAAQAQALNDQTEQERIANELAAAQRQAALDRANQERMANELAAARQALIDQAEQARIADAQRQAVIDQQERVDEAARKLSAELKRVKDEQAEQERTANELAAQAQAQQQMLFDQDAKSLNEVLVNNNINAPQRILITPGGGDNPFSEELVNNEAIIPRSPEEMDSSDELTKTSRELMIDLTRTRKKKEKFAKSGTLTKEKKQSKTTNNASKRPTQEQEEKYNSSDDQKSNTASYPISPIGSPDHQSSDEEVPPTRNFDVFQFLTNFLGDKQHQSEITPAEYAALKNNFDQLLDILEAKQASLAGATPQQRDAAILDYGLILAKKGIVEIGRRTRELPENDRLSRSTHGNLSERFKRLLARIESEDSNLGDNPPAALLQSETGDLLNQTASDNSGNGLELGDLS